MRVLMTGEHVYPLPRVSAGRTPKAMPSASGQRVHDWIAKGLAELGHEVLYLLTGRVDGAPPPGVTVVDRLVADADILHTYALRGPRYDEEWGGRARPYVATCHVDPRARGVDGGDAPASWIFVSRTIAAACGRTRFVVNGVDPEEYIYSDAKEDFLLFMASMDRPLEKGLDVALRVAAASGMRIIVAGTAQTPEAIYAAARMCEAYQKAEYIGDVQGTAKAQLLAAARAVIFPSRLNEAGPLVIAEALVSGTPVICSDRGASPEMVGAGTGFVCRTDAEYVAAIERAGETSPAACRDRAMSEFHYLRMAREYVREYEREVGGGGLVVSC